MISDLSLVSEWDELSTRYLPIAPQESIWRLSRLPGADDPEQGWKLHVSATILSACQVFKKVAPFLSQSGALFKAPTTLQELANLNCGLQYGFSQVGKFITVYPKDGTEAVLLARKLHRLTSGMPSPTIPFDLRFQRDSCVHYRYGTFGSLSIEDANGQKVSAIRDPQGNLCPDSRGPEAAVPAWAVSPFPRPRPGRALALQTGPLKTTFKAFEALSQRGRGGVYKALDLSVRPARLCILKEGRRHGETAWDQRDGFWRIRHEEEVLTDLSQSGVETPAVYTKFESEGHYYLITEFIAGSTLQEFLSGLRKKLPLAKAFHISLQLASVMHKIHHAGWVWRDCKPLNIMLGANGSLRPLDFEGACRIDEPDKIPWGTPGYVPPEWSKQRPESRVYEDLYALGVIFQELWTGRFSGLTYPLPPAGKLRRRIPKSVRKLISALVGPDPLKRPDAQHTLKVLEDSSGEFAAGENIFQQV
jgi:hypothetical protein